MLAVLRQRDFALLWFAGFVSLAGDWMLVVALPIVVYELTDSPLATGGVVIANRLPVVLFGSLAGVFVDRWDRKRTMVIANLARAPVLLLLFAANSPERVWVVYLVSFTIALFSCFFRPAENALLPRLVGSAHLVPANALNALNNNLSRMIGPAVGGLVVSWYGLGGVAVVDAASFLVAGVMIAMIAASGRPEHVPAGEAAEVVTGALAKVWDELLAGLRLIRGDRMLMVVFGVAAISGLGRAFSAR